MKDPVKECQVYKVLGCSHVDGFLCDMSTCSILKKYLPADTLQKPIPPPLRLLREGEQPNPLTKPIPPGVRVVWEDRKPEKK